MRPRGFTLLEVLIGLTVASVVVLLAHGVFAAVVDGSRGVEAARVAMDRGANAHRVLRSMFQSVNVGQPDAGFEGHPDRVEFSTWLLTASGWFEQRRVTLRLEDGRLVSISRGNDPLVLGDSVQSLRLDYLLEPGADARWVSEWVSPVDPPLAVRVRSTRRSASGQAVSDTSLYPITVRR